ncbi:phosphoglycerate mutase family protein [Bizionia sp. KMM 8389]
MRLIFAFVLVSLLSVSGCQEAPTNTSITTIYFIRHAEKDRSNPENKNPHLTSIGQNRANNWSDIFKHITFDAVYTTDYKRTIQTAQPTALKNNVAIEFYNPNSLNADKILKDNAGQTILIVGHSDTTPKFVNLFLGKHKYKNIEDSNNGNLYMLQISENKITDTLLTFPFCNVL